MKALTVGDNPEWVEGFYVGIIDPHQEERRIKGHCIHNGVSISLAKAVNPDTLCQGTGEADKDSDPVYVGDLFGGKDADGRDEIYEVVRLSNGEFRARRTKHIGAACDLWQTLHVVKADRIGNIHEITRRKPSKPIER